MRITGIESLILVNTDNKATTSLCTPGEEIDFRLTGDGLQTSNGRKLWEVDTAPNYVSLTPSGEGSMDMVTGWKFPTRKTYKSISVELRGSSTSSKVRGLTGVAKFVFTCGTQ